MYLSVSGKGLNSKVGSFWGGDAYSPIGSTDIITFSGGGWWWKTFSIYFLASKSANFSWTNKYSSSELARGIPIKAISSIPSCWGSSSESGWPVNYKKMKTILSSPNLMKTFSPRQSTTVLAVQEKSTKHYWTKNYLGGFQVLRNQQGT